MKQFKQSKKKGKTVIPVSAQDHLDSGVSEEDHGDRWIGSGDIAKAVRFYQRANSLYRKAIDLDHGETWISQDSMYNIARMQFVIFSKIVKTGQLPEILPLIEPETDRNVSVIPENIETVVQTHEEALRRQQQRHGLDLLYNYGQVLIEAGEETDKPEWFVKAASVFDEVLKKQIENFEEQTNRGDNNNHNDDFNDDIDDDSDNDENDSQTTPAIILETHLSFLQCLTRLIEFGRARQCSNDIQEKILASKSKADELVSQVQQLITQYYNSKSTDTRDHIQEDQVEEALVSIAQYSTIFANNIVDINNIWSNPDLPATPHKFLAQADAYLDMQEIVPADHDESTSGLLWEAYSQAAKILAQVVVEGTSVAVNRKILIARGDIDWLRAQLTNAAAIKNKDVLLRNANVYYQNSIKVPSLAQDMENELLVREATVKKQILDGNSLESIKVPNFERIIRGIREQGLLS